MLRFKLVFWLGLVVVTALWFVAAPRVLAASGLFALRAFMLQYSGLLAIAMLSAAMILSMRPRQPERWLDGMDKVYRLHKWLGIGGLVFWITHWLLVEGAKWVVGCGLGEGPVRGPRPRV